MKQTLILPAMMVAAMSFAACDPGFLGSGETKILVPPTAAALTAAGQFRQAFGTSARIRFSQNSGEVLSVESLSGPALASAAAPTTMPEALTFLKSFFAAWPDLFRVGTAPALASSTPLFRASEDSSFSSLRFDQLIQGYPLEGKGGIAYFKGGALVAIVAQLMTESEVAETEATSLDRESTVWLARNKGKVRLSDARWFPMPGGKTWMLLRETLTRDGFETRRTFHRPMGDGSLPLFAEHVSTPQAWTEAPADWQTDGVQARYSAENSDGDIRKILSTDVPGSLVLGFTVSGALADGQFVTVGSSSEEMGGDPSRISYDPIATTASAWTSEPDYDAQALAATGMARNVEKTLIWFRDQLGRRSWDDQGRGLYTSIDGNRSEDGKPDLNAYGGGGTILAGDATSRTGQYLTEALDVVAHEFAHSVIDTGQDFVYESEPGTLNEGLADVIGKCVEGFESRILGASIGEDFRDVVYPEDEGYPSRYSDFIYSAEDNGGVHINAGIVSKPLSLLALRTTTDVTSGCRQVLGLTLNYLKEVYLNPRLTLEDFFVGLSAYCRLRGDSSSYCAKLDDRLDDGELIGVAY